uniref:Wsv271-like protein n=1 Tax=Metapenaeus ensis majanivirus TaxID=2984279 RepID=A0A9C7C6E4_9VIRU|nr:MAG: wsv271-like protein [Metapenaeus ensis majanivirus]
MELAINQHVDNPYKRAIIRHSTSGDGNIIPFLEQEIKRKDPQITASEAIRIVNAFKNDMIVLFCAPVLDIIISLSSISNFRNDLYMGIVSFVENESANYKKYRDFSYLKFKELIYNLNWLYLEEEKKKTGKMPISLRELEILKKDHFRSNNNNNNKYNSTTNNKLTAAPLLASSLYFINDPIYSKIPIKIETIMKISKFLAAIKSLEQKKILCLGIFEYVVFLLRECIKHNNNNNNDSNEYFHSHFQDLENNDKLLSNTFISYEKIFKKKIQKLLNKQSNVDYSDDDDDDDNDDDDDDDDKANKCTTIKDGYIPIKNNNCYLTSGLFGDDSLFGKKLLSLVEKGDIIGLQNMTNQIFSLEKSINPFIVRYVNCLVDIIAIQNERLRNVKIFNDTLLPSSSSSSSSSSLPTLSLRLNHQKQNTINTTTTTTTTTTNNNNNGTLNLLNNSSLAVQEILKNSTIRLQFENDALAAMYQKDKAPSIISIAETITETQTLAHNLYSKIFAHLIQKSFPNETGDVCNNKNILLEKSSDSMSPFGPNSITSLLCAIEYVFIKKNCPTRIINLVGKSRNHSEEMIVKFNTAIEASMQNKKVADDKTKIVLEAKDLLANEGKALVAIIEHSLSSNNDVSNRPFSQNGLMQGLLTALAKVLYITRIKNVVSNNNNNNNNNMVLTIVPEVIEWLVNHLTQQLETAMCSLLQTKLPAGFDDYIYETNKTKFNNNSNSEISKLFTQIMADEYLKGVDNALNIPQINRYSHLKENLIKLVIDKSNNVLQMQCWKLTSMAIMIAIDYKRQMGTFYNLNTVSSYITNKPTSVTYLRDIDINTYLKRHIKNVLSAVCLAVAKDTALSIARLSNSHFKYILQRFNIQPYNIMGSITTKNNNTSTTTTTAATTTTTSIVNNRNNFNNTTNRLLNTFKNKNYSMNRDQTQGSLKKSSIEILNGIINEYQKSKQESLL